MSKVIPRPRILNKGVYAVAINGNSYWRAVLQKNGKIVTLGYFHKFREAAKTYVQAHVKLYGDKPGCPYQDPNTGKILRALDRY